MSYIILEQVTPKPQVLVQRSSNKNVKGKEKSVLPQSIV